MRTVLSLRREGNGSGNFRAWTDEPAYRHILLVLLREADLKVPVIYDAVLPMFVSESIQITDDISDFSEVLHIATSF